MDLNPYVYDFGRNLLLLKLGEIVADMTDLIDSKDTLESQSMLDRCDDIIDKHVDLLKNNS